VPSLGRAFVIIVSVICAKSVSSVDCHIGVATRPCNDLRSIRLSSAVLPSPLSGEVWLLPDTVLAPEHWFAGEDAEDELVRSGSEILADVTRGERDGQVPVAANLGPRFTPEAVKDDSKLPR
jgi:hypothetical protein